MPEIFGQLYYGNTLTQWLITLALIVLSFILGRVIVFFIIRSLSRITKHTSTAVDDILVDKLYQPATTILVILGIRYSLSVLTLPEGVTTFITNGFRFILTLIVTWAVIRAYDVIHDQYLIHIATRTETAIDDKLMPMIKSGLHFIIISLGLIVGLNNAGYNVEAILAGLGLGGLAFALAAQHTLGNLFGGLTILTDRHVKIGDRIQVEGGGQSIDGQVTQIGFRTTRIKTRYEGRIVNIPNSIVSNSAVVNVDSEDGRQVFAIYKLSPCMNYEKVQCAITLLKEIVENHDNTKELVITGVPQLSEISRDVMLLYWVKPEASNLKTRTAINLEIMRCFEENGIKFTDKSHYEYQRPSLV